MGVRKVPYQPVKWKVQAGLDMKSGCPVLLEIALGEPNPDLLTPRLILTQKVHYQIPLRKSSRHPSKLVSPYSFLLILYEPLLTAHLLDHKTPLMIWCLLQPNVMDWK